MPRNTMTTLERLAWEERRDHAERERLRDYQRSIHSRMGNATEAQLRAAAALYEHSNFELAVTAAIARAELRRRGLTP